MKAKVLRIRISALVCLLLLVLVPAARAAGHDTGHDMAVSADPRAAAIGRDILRQGGSAADAAIAMAVALTIVEPQSAGIGGGALLVFYDAKTKKLTALDGRETAPKAAKPDRFLGPDGKPLPFFTAFLGGRSIGVPGLLRLLEDAHRRWGKLPWPRLIEPSIKLAEDGFALSPRVQRMLADDTVLPKLPAARSLYYDASGDAKPAGTVIPNPALAETLRLIAKDGANAFYRGALAKDVVAAADGATPPSDLTLADLASYRVKERAVVCAPYRGDRVCGMEPPSGEVPVLEILGLLGHFDLSTHVADAEAYHLFAAASRLTYADRARWLGDPDFVPAPVKGLLDPAYLAARAKLIDPEKLPRGPATPGDPGGQHADLWGDEHAPEIPSTSNIAVVDKNGDAVDMTATIEANFGSHVMARGFLLNNELTDFSFAPEDNGRPVANRIEPGKRPLSAMSPTIVFGPDGKLKLVVGSAGGPPIITDVAKAIVAVVDWHDGMAQALARPNIDNRNGPTDFEVARETASIEAQLEAMGHDIKISKRESGLGGILVTPDGLDGAADPRREGAALGD